jgi:hypothetical protein
MGEEDGTLMAFSGDGALVTALTEIRSGGIIAEQGSGVGRAGGMRVVTGGAIEPPRVVEPEA